MLAGTELEVTEQYQVQPVIHDHTNNAVSSLNLIWLNKMATGNLTSLLGKQVQRPPFRAYLLPVFPCTLQMCFISAASDTVSGYKTSHTAVPSSYHINHLHICLIYITASYLNTQATPVVHLTFTQQYHPRPVLAKN